MTAVMSQLWLHHRTSALEVSTIRRFRHQVPPANILFLLALVTSATASALFGRHLLLHLFGLVSLVEVIISLTSMA